MNTQNKNTNTKYKHKINAQRCRQIYTYILITYARRPLVPSEAFFIIASLDTRKMKIKKPMVAETAVECERK